jgi:hypothetical protein
MSATGVIRPDPYVASSGTADNLLGIFVSTCRPGWPAPRRLLRLPPSQVCGIDGHASAIPQRAGPEHLLLSVAPSEGAIMAAPYGAKAPGLDVSEGARSL